MCRGGVKGKVCEEGRVTWVKRCPSGRLYTHPTTPSPAHTFHPSLLRPPLSIHVHGGFTRSTVSPPISAVSLTSALAQASFPSSLLRASLSILVQAVSPGAGLRTNDSRMVFLYPSNGGSLDWKGTVAHS